VVVAAEWRSDDTEHNPSADALDRIVASLTV
jgi:hypothetical protein